jgi:hypothetical protein
MKLRKLTGSELLKKLGWDLNLESGSAQLKWDKQLRDLSCREGKKNSGNESNEQKWQNGACRCTLDLLMSITIPNEQTLVVAPPVVLRFSQMALKPGAILRA